MIAKILMLLRSFFCSILRPFSCYFASLEVLVIQFMSTIFYTLILHSIVESVNFQSYQFAPD